MLEFVDAMDIYTPFIAYPPRDNKRMIKYICTIIYEVDISNVFVLNELVESCLNAYASRIVQVKHQNIGVVQQKENTERSGKRVD